MAGLPWASCGTGKHFHCMPVYRSHKMRLKAAPEKFEAKRLCSNKSGYVDNPCSTPSPPRQRPRGGSRTSRLWIHTPGSSADRLRLKKFYERGLSWPPSGPLTPGDALDAGRASTRRLFRPPHRPASHHHGVLTSLLAAAPAARDTAAPRQRPTAAAAASKPVACP